MKFRTFTDSSIVSTWNKLRDGFNKANDNKIRKAGSDGNIYKVEVEDSNGKKVTSFDLDMTKDFNDLVGIISSKGKLKVPTKGSASSKEERIELVKSLLAGKNYEDYIDTLNEMVKDDKNKVLLDAAFGGDLAEVTLDAELEDISVSSLNPTQFEIDLDKSLAWGLTKPEQIDNYYAKSVRLGKMPLVTYNGSHVIDGHHRWSQCFCFNPDAKMESLNFIGDLTPLQMLKSTQGSIAAEVGKVPVAKVEGKNMFDISEKELRSYVDSKLSDEVVEKFPKYRSNLNTREEVVDFIVGNCLKLIENHKPIKGAPSRSLMPQTDQAPGALERLDKGTVAMSNKYNNMKFRTFSIKTFANPNTLGLKSGYPMIVDDQVYLWKSDFDGYTEVKYDPSDWSSRNFPMYYTIYRKSGKSNQVFKTGSIKFGLTNSEYGSLRDYLTKSNSGTVLSNYSLTQLQSLFEFDGSINLLSKPLNFGYRVIFSIFKTRNVNGFRVCDFEDFSILEVPNKDAKYYMDGPDFYLLSDKPQYTQFSKKDYSEFNPKTYKWSDSESAELDIIETILDEYNLEYEDYREVDSFNSDLVIRRLSDNKYESDGITCKYHYYDVVEVDDNYSPKSNDISVVDSKALKTAIDEVNELLSYKSHRYKEEASYIPRGDYYIGSIYGSDILDCNWTSSGGYSRYYKTPIKSDKPKPDYKRVLKNMNK